MHAPEQSALAYSLPRPSELALIESERICPRLRGGPLSQSRGLPSEVKLGSITRPFTHEGEHEVQLMLVAHDSDNLVITKTELKFVMSWVYLDSKSTEANELCRELPQGRHMLESLKCKLSRAVLVHHKT